MRLNSTENQLEHQRRNECLLNALPPGVSKTISQLSTELEWPQRFVSRALAYWHQRGFYDKMRSGKKDAYWYANTVSERNERQKEFEKESLRLEKERQRKLKAKQERIRRQALLNKKKERATLRQQAEENRRKIAADTLAKQYQKEMQSMNHEHRHWMLEQQQRAQQKAELKKSLSRF